MKNRLKVGWFPEWLPKEQALENRVKNIIAKEFSKYWFINIETPAVEKNSVLTAKSWSEANQQIYWLHWLAQVEQWKEDNKDYSLRFDLTVPMSRYVLDHDDELTFPFKRYQIQKVWRWESHQKGRYKEFYQCDIDVVDKEVDIAYDAETIEVLAKTLQKVLDEFWVDKEFYVQLNNRKIYEAIFEELWLLEDQKNTVMRILDNYYKVEEKEFSSNLIEHLWEEKTKQLLKYIDFGDLNIDENEPQHIQEAKNEIKTVYELLQKKWINVNVDPYIVRGLDYYTGTVFETFIKWHKEFWSVCSGWRYDKLSDYILHNTDSKWVSYEWVWGSIGLSRLLQRLLDSWVLQNKERLVDVLLFNIKDQGKFYKEEIASLLRGSGIRVDLYYKNDPLRDQFKYADSKWIPLGIFIWEQEVSDNTVSIRNLITKNNDTTNKDNILESIKKQLNNIT